MTEAERHKERVKLENEKLALELQTKRLELDGLIGKDEESDLYKVKKEIDALSKDEQSLLEKYQRCSIVHDQLRSWVLKIYKVLLPVLEKSNKQQEALQRLRSIDLGNTEKLFVEMCGILQTLVDSYGHSEGGMVTVTALAVSDEFYNDETYKQRNVRVRPTTKPVLRRDESFRSSTSQQSAAPSTAGGPVQSSINVESEKEQREINSEFRDERKKKRTEIKKSVCWWCNRTVAN